MGHSTGSGRTAATAGERAADVRTSTGRAALRERADAGDETARNILQTDNNTLRSLVGTLESVYELTRQSGPGDTIEVFIQGVGEDQARRAIASLVNQSAWDGRISQRNAQWARGVDGALSEDEANRARVYTDRIHKAHLDQLANIMRRNDERRRS